MTPAQQRRDALTLANRSRSLQAQARHELADLSHAQATAAAARMLADADERIQSMSVYRLLCSCRLIGRTKARTMVRRAGLVTGDGKVRDLTPRQRGVLVDELEARCAA